jgi:hypothetical protein
MVLVKSYTEGQKIQRVEVFVIRLTMGSTNMSRKPVKNFLAKTKKTRIF